MAKRFSPEFKQQAIDYALSNSHESVAAIAQKLGVGYSTLDNVSQMRSWLPREIGGVLWFGNDDANMVAFTQIGRAHV